MREEIEFSNSNLTPELSSKEKQKSEKIRFNLAQEVQKIYQSWEKMSIFERAHWSTLENEVERDSDLVEKIADSFAKQNTELDFLANFLMCNNKSRNNKDVNMQE